MDYLSNSTDHNLGTYKIVSDTLSPVLIGKSGFCDKSYKAWLKLGSWSSQVPFSALAVGGEKYWGAYWKNESRDVGEGLRSERYKSSCFQP